MKEFLTKIWNNRVFAQIFRTKIGLAGFSFVWMSLWFGIYGSSANTAEWPMWMAMPGLAYLVGLTLVMMAYGWVINPLRDWRERKKRREEYENNSNG